MNLVFSQISLSHLYRLGQVVGSKTGRKYKLSDEKEVLTLLAYCDQSNDFMINRQYKAFIRSIDPDSLTELSARRIKLVANN